MAACALAAVLVTAALVAGAVRTIGPDRYAPDFLCFWTAADLMASGENPYDPAAQTRVQVSLGWDKARHGHGVYDFMPFYHAPWVALGLAALLPLGYGVAKVTWLVLGAEFLVASGWILSRCVPGVSAPLAIALVTLFGFSVKVVGIGQLVPVMLLLVAMSWKALDERRDLLGGALLAAASMKPHLTGILIAALSLWALRRGRWRVPAGVVAGMAALLGACTVVYPGWLAGMIAATGATPLPTSHYPGLGVTWAVLLGVAGLDGAARWAAWAPVALVALAAAARTAWSPRSTLADVYGSAMLATFVVAPYARYYDFPLLMVAVLPLVGERLSTQRRGLFVMTLLTLPSIQLTWLAATQPAPVVGVTRPEWTYAWVLLLVGAAWLYCPPDRRTQALSEPTAAIA